MSSQYKRLYILPNNLYAEGSPILIAAGALLLDTVSGKAIGQLKFLSLSDEKIKAVKIKIHCFDSANRELGDPFVYEYLDQNASRNDEFGSKTPIPMPNKATRSFAPEVIEVCFADQSVWSREGLAWQSVEDSELIASRLGDEYAVKGYQSLFGVDAKYAVLEHKDLWRCACGQINHKKEEKCCRCSNSLEELKTIDVQALRIKGTLLKANDLANSKDVSKLEKAIALYEKVKPYESQEEKISACKDKIKRIEANAGERSRRTKKAAIISAISLVVVGVLSLVGYFVVYPKILIANGDYKAYITQFDVKEFAIPDGVTSIADGAFSDCEFTNVTIPDSVTDIGYGAFAGCDKLTSIVIPDSVTSIEGRAFYDCDSLASVTISKSLTKIEEELFMACISLKTVTFGEDSQVTSIGDYAFSGCSSLEVITIPASLKRIGVAVFSKCVNLTSVTIPDTVTVIGEEMFEECSALKNIRIPDSVERIDGGAFSGCSSLTSIAIPNSVKYIEGSAFRDCSELTSLVVPESVNYIGYAMISGCHKLESIVLPFLGERKDGTDDNTLTHMLSYNEALRSLTSVTITGGESIGDYAFYGLSNLETVTFPNDITSIGAGAFKNTKISEITIPSSVTKIGAGAFSGCSALKNVVFENPEGWICYFKSGSYYYEHSVSAEDLMSDSIVEALTNGRYTIYSLERK